MPMHRRGGACMVGRRRFVAAGLSALGAVQGVIRPRQAAAQAPAHIGQADRVLAADGLTVDALTVDRPDEIFSGRMMVARFLPQGTVPMVTTHAPDLTPSREAWRLTVNASFFDPQDRPVRLLQEGDNEISRFRGGTSAVFWCREANCAITHARDYNPARPVDIAVESTPRVIADGQATSGVRDPDAVDSRAGIGIAGDGAVLVFATDRWGWSGVTFREVAQVMGPLYGARDVLMLDGGSSVFLRAEAPGQSVGTTGPGRRVPYFISFAGLA